MKKIISLLLSVLMLFSFSPAFADAYVAPPKEGGGIPEVGLLMREDFENGALKVPAGPWQSASQSVVETGTSRGKAWSLTGGGENLYYYLHSAGYGSSYVGINSGVLVYSYDAYIPQVTMESGAVIHLEPNTWSVDALTTGTKDGNGYLLNRTYLSTIYVDTSGAYAFSQRNATHTHNNTPYSGYNIRTDARKLSYNTWHNITTVVDYNKGVSQTYINGQHTNTSWNDIKTKFELSYFGITGGVSGTTHGAAIYVDNVSISRLGGPVKTEVVGMTADTLDVQYNVPLNPKQSINPGKVIVKNMSTGATVAATKAEIIGGNIIRASLDTTGFTKGVHYEVLINQPVSTLLMGQEPIDGAKSLFVRENAALASTTTILDMDFDNAATQLQNMNFVRTKSNAPNTTETQDFVVDNTMLDSYVDYIDDGDGGQKIQLLTGAPMASANNVKALRFPFAEGKKISGGVLNLSFDTTWERGTEYSNSNYYRLLYGLHDTTREEDTFLKYGDANAVNDVWSNSTNYVSLMAWNAYEKSIMPGNQFMRTRGYDYWGGATTEDGYEGGDWPDGASYQYIALASNATTYHFDVSIDMDNNTYSISIDGAEPVTMDYLPGNATNGIYDAFEWTIQNDVTTEHPAYATLDNLLVTHTAPVPVVKDIVFGDGNGNTYHYNSGIPASVRNATITFSIPMDVETAEQYISGLDVTSVSVNENQVHITFEEGLLSGQDYSLVLDSGLKSAVGAPMGYQTAFTFQAQKPRCETVFSPLTIMKDGREVSSAADISEGDVLSLSADVTNGTGVPIGYTIVLEAFDENDTMVAITAIRGSTTAQVYHTTLSETVTATAGFSGASKVKALLLSDLYSMNLLAAPTVK